MCSQLKYRSRPVDHFIDIYYNGGNERVFQYRLHLLESRTGVNRLLFSLGLNRI
jgi:hypothetical protein